MKLSRALLIVLLLHVVAVSGIIAFNVIKTRQSSLPSSSSPPIVGITSTETRPQTHLASPPVAQRTGVRTQPKASDSGKTYIVVKGDNPVTIAKKFKVSYDDLIELNHIDDARRLKIGQKLLIPSKPAKKPE
jgi:LysM repeat protein